MFRLYLCIAANVGCVSLAHFFGKVGIVGGIALTMIVGMFIIYKQNQMRKLP